MHHYDPESKQKHAMETCQFSNPQKFTVQASANTILCIVFWFAEGVLLIDFMPHKVTVTGLYYADLLLLHKPCVAIKDKCGGQLTQVPLLLHDNAPAHRLHAALV